MSDINKISIEELSGYGPVSDLNKQAIALVKHQQATWNRAGENYASLSDVQTKVFNFGHFNIMVQNNPGRMRSSSAKTDPHSLAKRPCALCVENMLSEQKAIDFGENYLIVTNPYPIFPYHLTIPRTEHVFQRLKISFPDMLDLSRQLYEFTLFYNGPGCGASIPDHLHFQAVNKGTLPVEKEYAILKMNYAKAYFKKNDLQVVAVENYLRRFIALVSENKDAITGVFDFLYSALEREQGDEPMMNVLAFYENGKWHVIIFPRRKQRPSHFYKSDENRIIVGPATVEMGGILILPRQNDFNSMNHKVIAEIYDEVVINAIDFNHMLDLISRYN